VPFGNPPMIILTSSVSLLLVYGKSTYISDEDGVLSSACHLGGMHALEVSAEMSGGSIQQCIGVSSML
jgi:hypothetical protein